MIQTESIERFNHLILALALSDPCTHIGPPKRNSNCGTNSVRPHVSVANSRACQVCPVPSMNEVSTAGFSTTVASLVSGCTPTVSAYKSAASRTTCIRSARSFIRLSGDTCPARAPRFSRSTSALAMRSITLPYPRVS